MTTRAMSGCRRLVDLTLAFLLLSLLSPLLLLLFLVANAKGGGIRKDARLGRWAKPFRRYAFRFPEAAGSSSLRRFAHLPVLFNILIGDMAFVGPRAISLPETFRNEPLAWKRYDSRPGLMSLWWMRKRANIAYVSEIALDVEYVETSTVWGDLGIALRAIPAFLFGGSGGDAPAEVKFLGVRIDNLTMAAACRRIVQLTERNSPAQVCFVNADCFNIAAHHPQYRSTLSGAELVLADGIGVRIAGKIFRQRICENINGTDMLPYLCEALQSSGRSLFLLGGRAGIADAAANWMRERYPHLRLAGTHHGYFRDQDEPRILREISDSGAEVVLVALGAPRQDNWIADHRDELGKTVAIGVGGLLDFYSGRIPRAPVWVRELGMEWLYRFLQEPGRMWRRYFVGNVVFLWRVMRESIAARKLLSGSGGIAS